MYSFIFLLLNVLAIKAGSYFKSDGAGPDTVFLRELIKYGKKNCNCQFSFPGRKTNVWEHIVKNPA